MKAFQTASSIYESLAGSGLLALEPVIPGRPGVAASSGWQ